jgi:hypothetical protein
MKMKLCINKILQNKSLLYKAKLKDGKELLNKHNSEAFNRLKINMNKILNYRRKKCKSSKENGKIEKKDYKDKFVN